MLLWKVLSISKALSDLEVNVDPSIRSQLSYLVNSISPEVPSPDRSYPVDRNYLNAVRWREDHYKRKQMRNEDKRETILSEGTDATCGKGTGK